MKVISVTNHEMYLLRQMAKNIFIELFN